MSSPLVHFPAENTQPGAADSNALLAAELQALAIGVHMFGLDGLANMSAKRVNETPKDEQVSG